MLKQSFDARRRQGQFIIFGLTGLLIVSLISNVLILSLVPKPLVVLLPGEVSGKYLISQNQYDNHYLSDASSSVADTFLNVTPGTVDWRKKEVLRWAHPESTQSIADQLDEEAKNIVSQKLTTSFSVKDIDVDAKKESATVTVEGVLTRFITDRQFSQERVNVIVIWDRDARGAALIKSLSWEKIE